MHSLKPTKYQGIEQKIYMKIKTNVIKRKNEKYVGNNCVRVLREYLNWPE